MVENTAREAALVKAWERKLPKTICQLHGNSSENAKVCRRRIKVLTHPATNLQSASKSKTLKLKKSQRDSDATLFLPLRRRVVLHHTTGFKKWSTHSAISGNTPIRLRDQLWKTEWRIRSYKMEKILYPYQFVQLGFRQNGQKGHHGSLMVQHGTDINNNHVFWLPANVEKDAKMSSETCLSCQWLFTPFESIK